MWVRLTFDLELIMKEHPETPYCFEVDRWRLAAAMIGSDMFVFRDRCPHMGSSFEGGWIEGAQVVCPKHRYHFDPKDQNPNRAPGCLSLIEWRRSGELIEINLK